MKFIDTPNPLRRMSCARKRVSMVFENRICVPQTSPHRQVRPDQK